MSGFADDDRKPGYGLACSCHGIFDGVNCLLFHRARSPNRPRPQEVLSSFRVWLQEPLLASKSLGLRGYHRDHPCLCQSQKRLYKAEGQVAKLRTASYLQNKGYFVTRGMWGGRLARAYHWFLRLIAARSHSECECLSEEGRPRFVY